MSAVRRRLRASGVELAVEAALVVFAVLVALAVDQWNEGRELAHRAARAHEAILVELRTNQGELESSKGTLDSLQLRLAADVQRMAAGGSVDRTSLGAVLPDFTDAAWVTAQATGAVANMEYDWVLAAARIYGTQDSADELMAGFLDSMAAAVGRGPDVDRFSDLAGRLFLLREFYRNLETAYAELLDGPQ